MFFGGRVAIISRNAGGQIILRTNLHLDVPERFQPGMMTPDGIVFYFRVQARLSDGYWLASDEFYTERVLAAAPAGAKLVFVDSERGAWVQDELLLAHDFFRAFIDFSAPESFPPYQYEAPAKCARLAVFTHAYNEDLFLKVFVQHYARLAGVEHVYVIDHGSDQIDRAWLAQSGCQVVRIPRGEVDHLNIKKYVECFQRFLLTQYRWVISVDADELLVHRNGEAALIEWLDAQVVPCVVEPGLALEVVQHPEEPELVGYGDIARQRRHFVPEEAYRKPALASMPTTWSLGFHQTLDSHALIRHPDLCLFHLAHVSVQESLRRNRQWNAVQRSRGDRLHVPQERITSLEALQAQHKKMIEKGTLDLPMAEYRF